MEPQSQNDFRMSTKFDAVFGSVVNESGRSERDEKKVQRREQEAPRRRGQEAQRRRREQEALKTRRGRE